MIKYFFLLLLLFISKHSFSDSTDVFEKWNILDKKISAGLIKKDYAIHLLSKYETNVIKYFYSKKGKEVNRSDWVFPLKYYSSVSFYKNGKDYNEKEYDYFDGNKSWNHPANDIIIADTNNDCLDDIIGNHVDVVSISSGVVVATDTTWEPGSILRAGKYIRIYDITNKKILYYSHLNKVFKKPGDIINAGDKIGEVGRTGRSAILPDGQTHLHIAMLYLNDGYPLPEPLFEDLKKALELNKNK